MSKQYRVKEIKENLFHCQHKGWFGWNTLWDSSSWDDQMNGPYEFKTEKEAWAFIEEKRNPSLPRYHYE